MEKFSLNGEVIFCNSSSLLLATCSTAEYQQVKLDFLESLVLGILVVRANNLVSNDEFLSHWRSSEVTLNSLSRVISLIRSKLKKVGLSEKVIINTPKKGYTLIAVVENLTDFNDTHSIKKTIVLNTGNRIKQLYFMLFIFLIAIMASSIIDHNEPSNRFIKNISNTELINNTDIKLELAFNLNNNFIAYVTRAYEEKYWKIAIFDRYSGEDIIIKDNNINLRKPTWLNENQLIYRSYDEQKCKIKMGEINFLSKSYTTRNLFSCNPDSYSSSIARLNSSQILFTEAELGSKASSLYTGNVVSGLIKPIDVDNEGGLGIYNVISSPNSELIVLLSSPDSITNKIRLVNPNNEWKVVWSEKFNATNISVGWDGSSLSFRNNKGGISIVNFQGNDEINRTHLPFIVPVHNVTSTNEGLLFTSGEFVTQNIAYTDLTTSNVTLLTKGSNAKNKLAEFYTKDIIFYVSNTTGINQIWMFNLKSLTSRQVSSFRNNKDIINISLNQSYSKIALEYDNSINIFELSHDNILSKDSIKIEGTNPQFYKEKLIFTKVKGLKLDLHSFSLIDSQFNKLETDGGYIAKSNGEELYYSKRYAPGIWLYQEFEKDTLILDLPSSSYQWHIDLDNIYYRNDIGDNFKFNVTKKLTKPLNSDSCKVLINLNDNKCLSVKISPSANRMILLKW